tara:strand:+ start:630 stop:1349 length:720 start_codon:yes stop_codon:yes gene_type:complete
VENKVIPISDINPARNVPVVSRIFIIISSLTFLFLQPKNNIDLLNYFYKYAAIPCELINNLPISANQFYNNNCSLEPDIVIFPDKNILLSIIVSLFLHANFLHILGNLWSFWIFGNNVEDKLGKIRFILFLIVSGVISIVGHSFLNVGNLNPIVGASGIVSALMGAYLYLFPNAKLLVLVPFGVFFPTTIKAKYFMIFWLISQFIIAIQSNNISWEAHISGFLFGYLLLKVSKFRRSII